MHTNTDLVKMMQPQAEYTIQEMADLAGVPYQTFHRRIPRLITGRYLKEMGKRKRNSSDGPPRRMFMLDIAAGVRFHESVVHVPLIQGVTDHVMKEGPGELIKVFESWNVSEIPNEAFYNVLKLWFSYWIQYPDYTLRNVDLARMAINEEASKALEKLALVRTAIEIIIYSVELNDPLNSNLADTSTDFRSRFFPAGTDTAPEELLKELQKYAGDLDLENIGRIRD